MKAGDTVTIFNTTMGGDATVEGEAKLIQPSEFGNSGLNDGWEYWQVEFIDEPGVYFDRVIQSETSS